MKAVELGYQFRMIEKPRYRGCDKPFKSHRSDKWLRSVVAEAKPFSKRKRSVSPTNKPIAERNLAAEFKSLVLQWKRETFFQSSLTKQFSHPAYLRIMAMGPAAIPLVLAEMQNSQDGWFFALKFMAGTDVSAGVRNFDDAKAKWLEWGYKNNYL